MTVKALKRQLMAAIAMIMVSLIALSSSTYAWFTMNKTVTASGLNITARTEGGILIKEEGSSEDGQESVKFTTAASNAAIKLLPTSTADLSTWVHAAALTSEAHDADVNTYTILNLSQNRAAGYVGYGSVTDSNSILNYYYAYDVFKITRDNNSKSFTDLYVSECTVKKVDATTGEVVAGNLTALSNSLRVAVKCGSTVKIFAPLATEARAYTVITNIVDNGEGSVTRTSKDVTAIPSANSATQPLLISQTKLYDGEVESLNGVDVEVYVYFEGEDKDHATKNIGVLDNVSVSLKFSCSAVTPN